jgi:hypothetical protein
MIHRGDQHPHDFGGAAWLFSVPENTLVFLCEEVFSGESPILRVVHGHDGDWQFLCGGDHSNSMPRVVCFGCAAQRDHSVLALADLAQGWAAERARPSDGWVREHTSLDED